MSQLLVIRQGQMIVSACYGEQEGIFQFHISPQEEKSEEGERTVRIGDIYVGQVQNLIPRLNAAFLSIAPGINGYLPLEKNKHLCFANPKKKGKALYRGFAFSPSGKRAY